MNPGSCSFKVFGVQEYQCKTMKTETVVMNCSDIFKGLEFH